MFHKIDEKLPRFGFQHNFSPFCPVKLMLRIQILINVLHQQITHTARDFKKTLKLFLKFIMQNLFLNKPKNSKILGIDSARLPYAMQPETLSACLKTKEPPNLCTHPLFNQCYFLSSPQLMSHTRTKKYSWIRVKTEYPLLYPAYNLHSPFRSSLPQKTILNRINE